MGARINKRYTLNKCNMLALYAAPAAPDAPEHHRFLHISPQGTTAGDAYKLIRVSLPASDDPNNTTQRAAGSGVMHIDTAREVSAGMRKSDTVPILSDKLEDSHSRNVPDYGKAIKMT